jgi:hypothetical protein
VGAVRNKPGAQLGWVLFVMFFHSPLIPVFALQLSVLPHSHSCLAPEANIAQEIIGYVWAPTGPTDGEQLSFQDNPTFGSCQI